MPAKSGRKASRAVSRKASRAARKGSASKARANSKAPDTPKAAMKKKAGANPGAARQETPRKRASQRSVSSMSEGDYAPSSTATDAPTLLSNPPKALALFAEKSMIGLNNLQRSIPLIYKIASVLVVAAYFGARTTVLKSSFRPATRDDCKGGAFYDLELSALEAGWWILLGVLSSVGFGTGLHSGIMFLFPHIMALVFAADAEGTVAGMETRYLHPCKFTIAEKSQKAAAATFFDLLIRSALPCMLWGFGTALGELPPYFLCYAARSAGKTPAEFEEELEEARNSTAPIARMKVWTIDFTRKYGFWGVLALASWPNAAFDMCGMCAGLVQMPFLTFFGACAIGKGVIKVMGQACFFIMLFGKELSERLAKLTATVGDMYKKGAGKQLSELLMRKRGDIVIIFKKQTRFTLPELLHRTGEVVEKGVLAGQTVITAKGLEALYKEYKFKDGKAAAARIVESWDENNNGVLESAEVPLGLTDSKVSFGDLDKQAGGSWIGLLWDGFLISVFVYFGVSVINSLAALRYAEKAAMSKKKKK